jgi:hypothetical protein
MQKKNKKNILLYEDPTKTKLKKIYQMHRTPFK